MGKLRRIRHFPGVEETTARHLRELETNVSDAFDDADDDKARKFTPRNMVGDFVQAQAWDLVYVTAAGRVMLPRATGDITGAEVLVVIAAAVSVDVSAMGGTVNDASTVTIAGVRSKRFTAFSGGWYYDA